MMTSWIVDITAGAVFACARILPFPFVRKIARSMGWCLSFALSRERAIIEAHASALVPELRGRPCMREIFAQLGETAAECFTIQDRLAHDTFEVNHPDLFRTLLSQGTAVLALSAHTSNWELLAGHFRKRGLPVSVVGRAGRTALFQLLLQRIRRASGVQTIWRDSSSLSKSLVRLFHSPNIVGVLIDQDTRVASASIPFFGVPAKTPIGVIELAKRLNIPIVSTLIFRVAPSHYRIFLDPLNSNAPTEDIARQFNATLESYLRLFPTQWVWFHKRWRTLPDGTTLSTRDYLSYLSKLEGSTPRASPA